MQYSAENFDPKITGGCINLDNAANNGLSDAIDFVEELYTEITDRADLWAIGSFDMMS